MRLVVGLEGRLKSRTALSGPPISAVLERGSVMKTSMMISRAGGVLGASALALLLGAAGLMAVGAM